MSYILPVRDLEPKDRQQFRMSVQKLCIERALNIGLARVKEELVIRDLFPSDLGLKDWSIPDSQPWIRYNIHQCTLAFYKVLQLGANPTASKLTFRWGQFGAVTK